MEGSTAHSLVFKRRNLMTHPIFCDIVYRFCSVPRAKFAVAEDKPFLDVLRDSSLVLHLITVIGHMDSSNDQIFAFTGTAKQVQLRKQIDSYSRIEGRRRHQDRSLLSRSPHLFGNSLLCDIAQSSEATRTRTHLRSLGLRRSVHSP